MHIDWSECVLATHADLRIWAFDTKRLVAAPNAVPCRDQVLRGCATHALTPVDMHPTSCTASYNRCRQLTSLRALAVTDGGSRPRTLAGDPLLLTGPPGNKLSAGSRTRNSYPAPGGADAHSKLGRLTPALECRAALQRLSICHDHDVSRVEMFSAFLAQMIFTLDQSID